MVVGSTDEMEDGPSANKWASAGKGGAPLAWVLRVRTSAWGRPLALVTAMLASHAAMLLLGIAIGRRIASVTDASPAGFNVTSSACGLSRRFSSGPGGMHSRLCYA